MQVLAAAGSPSLDAPRRRVARAALTALVAALFLVAGCGDEAGGDGAAHKPAPDDKSAVAAKKPAKGKPAKAVPAPRSVTPGDVLPPLPPLPRRVASGAGPARQLPVQSCANMAPDATFKLSRRIEVSRRGVDVSTELNKATKPKAGAKAVKPAAGKAGILELCLFHKWRAREPGENRTHTGRIHHFVAAFPGTDVSSWTADELTRAPKTLPQDALWLSAGWATILPTGLPDRPAIAVVSGRFYDGALGEEVHYVRQARMLRQHRGRWAWVPLSKRAWGTLDIEHIRSTCGRGGKGGAGCGRAKARASAAERASARREKVRAARLKGKGSLKPGKSEGDPQSIWIARARKIVKEGRWKEAIDLALKAEVVCGEPGRASRKVIARALRMGKIKPEGVEPELNKRPLCEPLTDKAPPRVRKMAKRDD